MWEIAISKAAWRLHSFCLILALGSFVWGYNVGVLASVLVHPGFEHILGEPDAPRRGLITAVYYLGSWLSYVLFAHPAADRLGRRNAALGGMSVICLGQGLQTGAAGPYALAMVVAGRVIAGMGTAVISTSVPLYQSEISPPGQRGRYVVMNHVGFVAGLSSGFWVGYAMTFWNNDRGSAVGWRFSLGASFVPALIFVAALPFMRESPRWLVEHGKTEEALETLRFYREGYYGPDEEVRAELSGIERSVSAFRTSGLTWVSLFSDGSLSARMWRAALLQFLAHLCGATAMKYYLPALFQALGFGHRVSLLAGGIESTLKTGCTVVDMLLIDRAGRRLTLIAGAGVMAFALLINGALPLAYPDNVNRAADYVCVVFIFVYALGYSLGFGPAAWVYGAEVFPTAVRARGLSLAASCGALAAVIVAQVWPVGIANLGSSIYFFFMAVNLISIPVIYLFYPETKGRPLEDMEELFGAGSGASSDDLLIGPGEDHAHPRGSRP
ncbi:general substrate transporter [Thermothelomyces heterothallicus CBS 202.75]|uniref:general substrate transporter n=1 Tax=Thermothelomyces heterothallicus CBS 202.75 TaxID=1149848 RepID=UPI003742D638